MANNTSVFNIKINGKEELVSLDKLINQNAQSVGELKDAQDQLNQAFEQAAIGTEAYNQLQSELRGVNTQLKVIEESVADLTLAEKFEGIGKIVGAVGSTFAFATTSIQAFGDENSRTAQQLQELEVKISAIIQGQQALQAITEAFSSKNKVFVAAINSIKVAWTNATAASTTFGRVTKGVLVSTGIGVAFVALGAAIGFIANNFDKIKEKIAPLIKAFEPLLNTVRNIASFLTGGLIDNTLTTNLQNQIDTASQNITKIQENTNKQLDNLSKLAAGRYEAALVLTNKQAEVQSKGIIDTYDETRKRLENIFKGIVKDAKDSTNIFASPELSMNAQDYLQQIQQVFNDTEQRSTSARDRVQTLINVFDDLTKGIKEGENSSRQFFQQFTDLQPTAAKDLQTFINDTQPKLVDGLTKLAEVETKSAEVQNNINQRNLDIQKLRTSLFATEIANFKELIDYLSQVTKLSQTRGADALFVQIGKQVELLIDNLNNEDIKALFSGDFVKKLQETKGLNLFDETEIPKVIKLLDVYQEKIIQLAVRQQSDLAQQLNIQTQLDDKTKEILSNAVTTVTTGGDLKAVFEAINKEIDKYNLSSGVIFKEGFREILSNTNKIVREIFDLKASVILTNKELKTTQILLDFDKVGESIDRFKNGTKLSVDEIDRLAQILPDIDFTQALAVQPFEKQNQILEDIAKKEIELANERLLLNLGLVKTTTEANNLIKQTNKEIEDITKNTNDAVNANNELKKSYEEQLEILEQQNKIDNLRKQTENVSTFRGRRAAIAAQNQLQEEQIKLIEKQFETETKGLNESDARYKIAAINKQAAINAVAEETERKLREINRSLINSLETNLNELFSFVGNATSELAAEFTARNQEDLDLLQEAANLISQKITENQEQLAFIDELINERKAIIQELEAAAAEATGGQRQEILKQIDAEAEATRMLIADKKKQKQAEADLQAQLAKNAAEQAKIAKENEEIQKRAAVINQIAAVSQAGIAVAKAFTPDPASAAAPFGIGLAIRTAAAIALGASLFSLIGQIRRLDFADGGYIGDKTKKRAEGGYTGPSTLAPDSTGERPMYHTVQLHEKEWVAPRWMTQSSKYGSIINELEKTRVRGFADGGSITPITTQSITNEQLTGLLVANLNKPVYVAVTDINEGQSRVQVIENRATI